MLCRFAFPTGSKARRALFAAGCGLAALAIAVVGARGFSPDPATAVMEDFADLPKHLKRLVVFRPDPGQLIYFQTAEQQMLYYSRTVRQRRADYCNETSNEMWSVNITNHGSNVPRAHADFVTAGRSLRALPGLVSEAAFEDASEGTSVTFDTREQTGNILCGIYRIVTLFRMGGAVFTTTEEYWNETPVRTPFLAHLLARELGYSTAMDDLP